MDNFDEVLNVVFDAIREYNSQESESKLTPARETPLIGGNARFDSVAAVVLGSILEEHLERLPAGTRLGEEIERITVQGALAPDLWMKGATGEPVSAQPLIRAAARALDRT
mgnify:CR=1 FL=1